MHGLIFTSLEGFLTERGVLDSVPGEGGYRDDRVYDDGELLLILRTAAERAGESEDEFVRGFGVYLGRTAFPELSPRFYEEHGGLLAALLDVEAEIHERVRNIVPGAAPPHLRVSRLGEHGVVVAYTSARRLCRLLEGLIAGTAEVFGEPVSIEQPQCMHRGDPSCSFVVELDPAQV
jgi:predicted hydrocarbon binding protein